MDPQDEFVRHGLPVLAVMGLCSVVALWILLWRVWELRTSKVIPRGLRIQLGDLIGRGALEEARTTCRLHDGPFARLALAGLRVAGGPRSDVKERIEEVGRVEAAHLSAGLGTLDLVAVLCPMLGLFGTVWGMIDMFLAVQSHGVGDAAALAGGIGTALYTTLGGLAVAVPARVAHSYLLGRVDGVVLALEEEALVLLDRLDERRSAPATGASA